MSRISDLTKILSGNVDTTFATLSKASQDASLFEVDPVAVAVPKDVEDIKKLVRFVSDHQDSNDINESRLTLTARSAGTDMSGGPLTESIVVDFTKNFNHIKNVEVGYAVTEPGVYYRDFDKATLAKDGQIMPSYPASRELCTVGGMVANNSGGEKTLTYGKTDRYVRRLKMVTADAQEHEFKPLTMSELEEKKKLPSFESDIYKKMHELIENNYDIIQKAKPTVSKNSSGYYLWNVLDKEKGTFDLTKMIVGSQGTLGLITEIEFALIKPKLHSRLLVVFLNDMTKLGVIANHILQFKPESFESYDDHTFKIAVKFLPKLVKKMKGDSIKLFIMFLPELWAVIKGGVPKLVLMAEFTADTDQEAVTKAEQAQKSLLEFGLQTKVTETESDAKKYWTIRRESFNMLRQHVRGLRTAPFIDDFVVKPDQLPVFLPKLYNILDNYDLTYTIAGHVGDGNFHIIPLMNLEDAEAHRAIEELSVQVYKLVHEFDGSITGEHNDGIIRTPFVKMQFGEEMYKLFEETKKIWDPKNIFNPGKKVNGTLEYAFKHIVKSS